MLATKTKTYIVNMYTDVLIIDNLFIHIHLSKLTGF